uniref:metal-dependent hydrolase n=1 Tax=Haloprofundus sp. MHR1 TaxID=2572921 RepID=UPI001F27A653|nr:metal-dependent hydrolase [Haloprofundus sp. MHR1]
MWPWEHLAFGYILYSVAHRLVARRGVTTPAALAVAFATQLPDLIDKPLAWTFEVLPSGVSLAHSIFFVPPVTLAAYLVGRVTGFKRLWIPFLVGYLSHLVGDGVSGVAYGDSPSFSFLLWPLYETSSPSRAGLFSNFFYYLGNYMETLASPEGVVYILLELGLLGTAFLLWLWDGAPGLPRFRFGSSLLPNRNR